VHILLARLDFQPALIRCNGSAVPDEKGFHSHCYWHLDSLSAELFVWSDMFDPNHKRTREVL
jgi:hypothetical protein